MFTGRVQGQCSREPTPWVPVLRVMATDLDEASNAGIAYTINVDKAVIRQLFKLDSKTGELTTVGGLDFEERELHNWGGEQRMVDITLPAKYK